MIQPNTQNLSGEYKYGFNGQEKDDEIKGESNHYNFTYRGYDSRLGRFTSVDPLTSSYPFYSPYQFASNTPIQAIDLDGLEGVKMINHLYNTTTIYIDMVYTPLTFKNFLSGNHSGFTRNQARLFKKGIMNEFKKGGTFVDNNNFDEQGNPYTVHLEINMIETPTKQEAYQRVVESWSKGQHKVVRLEKMADETKHNTNGTVSITRAKSITGKIATSAPNNSHTNTHELWHNLTHNHPNASQALKTQINPTNQEPGHFQAGGIFVYRNDVLGRSIQNLNQGNINDALNTVGEIDVTPIVTGHGGSGMGQKHFSDLEGGNIGF
jgi:RHS repeat-associated protein